jgi:hypothetical protein
VGRLLLTSFLRALLKVNYPAKSIDGRPSLFVSSYLAVSEIRGVAPQIKIQIFEVFKPKKF